MRCVPALCGLMIVREMDGRSILSPDRQPDRQIGQPTADSARKSRGAKLTKPCGHTYTATPYIVD